MEAFWMQVVDTEKVAYQAPYIFIEEPTTWGNTSAGGDRKPQFISEATDEMNKRGRETWKI